MGLLEDLLCSLDESLTLHDNKRKKVQNELQEIHANALEESDLLEEKMNGEIQDAFDKNEKQILNLIYKLNNNTKEGSIPTTLTRQINNTLSSELKFEIKHSERAKSFVDSYALKISKVKIESSPKIVATDKIEGVVNLLEKQLERFCEHKNAIQNDFAKICTKRRSEADELKERINKDLECYFTEEDARIQEVVKMVRVNIHSENPDEIKAIETKVKLALLTTQKYAICDFGESDDPEDLENLDYLDYYDLVVTKEVSLKRIDFEERKPTNITSSFTEKGEFSLSFAFFSDDEIKILKTATNLSLEIVIKIWDKSKGEDDAKTLTKSIVCGSAHLCFFNSFSGGTTYCMKTRIKNSDICSQWSDIATFLTPESIFAWAECPRKVSKTRKYSINSNNPRIVTSDAKDNEFCTVIGNTPIAMKKVISWGIKILSSLDGKGLRILVGVAPFNICQNDNNNHEHGWYFDLAHSTLYSGPPHDYRYEKYSSRKKVGEFIQDGSIVGVIMDTKKGNLSFTLNGEELGVAYRKIPLDKPLVPCVLGLPGCSVELIL